MTTTYDPNDPVYLDEADVRTEMTRVFDLCHGCRSCVTLCSSFPTLFEMIDRHDDRDAGRLTPAQQDRVVSECIQCKLCYVDCPYVPDQHDWNLDFPRLMLRASAMAHTNGHISTRERFTTQLLARTDRVGALATTASPLANRVVTAPPGSLMRKAVAKVTGVSSVRLLAPFAKQRFSTWFKQRPKIRLSDRQGMVTVFPTCLVEYHETNIGKDLVKVYERNGIECEQTGAGCCGAPWLQAGNAEAFTNVAEKNVEILAAEVRNGTDIVVAQPTCGYVLKQDYADYMTNAERRRDAELVAEHTYDAAEYLIKIHQGASTRLDTNFDGDVVDSITYHAPCHVRAQDVGFKSRDLLMLTGADVTVIQQCSGVAGMWGLRAGNEATSIAMAKALGGEIDAAGGDLVAGDCHLANNAIVEQTGRVARHPLEILARAYGIPEERHTVPGLP